jgi:hypothetical protein
MFDGESGSQEAIGFPYEIRRVVRFKKCLYKLNDLLCYTFLAAVYDHCN